MARSTPERIDAVSCSSTVCVYQIESPRRLLWLLEAMFRSLEQTRPKALLASLAMSCALAVGLAPSATAAQRARSLPRQVVSHRPSPYPAGATRAKLHPRPSEYARAAAAGGSSAPATHSKGAKKKAKKKKLTGNPARALAAFEAMQAHYYIKGSGLYEGEPFSYLWPFSQALAATVSMANVPHLGVAIQHELSARLYGLRSYLDVNNSGASEGTFTSTLAAFDGTVAPPDGAGRHEVLRRQRLGGDRAGAAVQADPRTSRAGQRRGDHGVRDGRLAVNPGTGLPRRPAVRQRTGQRPNATRSPPRRRRSWACSCTS